MYSDPIYLKGKLKLEVEPGTDAGLATDYVIFRQNPETGAQEEISLPYELDVTEPGHEGGGVHDWHAGYERFTFRRTGDGPLKIKCSVDPTQGEVFKTATLHLVPGEVDVDANRDGDITFDGLDRTKVDKAFRFWLNNDKDDGNYVDGTDWEEDDLETGNPDYQDGVITWRRDLEDFTRLWINAYQVVKSLGGSTNLTVEMEWKPMEGETWATDDGAPAIKLFKAVETDGGTKYLTEQEGEAKNQIEGEIKASIGSVTKGTVYTFQEDFFNDLTEENPSKYLLFEGVAAGKGLLIARFKKGEVVMELPGVYMELKDVKDMYETYTVGDVSNCGVDYSPSTWPASAAEPISGQDLPNPESDEEKDYVMFVHGWNMHPWEKDAYARTAFKRLWHQGFKGRFGAFRWPTFWWEEGVGNGGMQITPWGPWVPLPDNFDASEQRAWNSAKPLHDLLLEKSATFNVNGTSKVRLFGHSMGNIVCSEALRQFSGSSNSPAIHTYISCQAALSAHVWNNATPRMNLNPVWIVPDIYGYYWKSGESNTDPSDWESHGCSSYMDMLSYMPSGTNYINYYNVRDYALGTGWQLNQKLKPNNSYGYSTAPFMAAWFFKSEGPDSMGNYNPRTLVFPNDRYEAISYAAPSYSLATGAEPSTMMKSVNLENEKYGFDETHKCHSGQFRSTIQKRWPFWEQFVKDLDL